MGKELIKVKEKEILQLKELICLKDEALAAKEEEIKELNRQLANTTAAKDQDSKYTQQQKGQVPQTENTCDYLYGMLILKAGCLHD